MTEDLRRFLFMRVFCAVLTWSKESDTWQPYWLVLVDINPYAKKYQTIPNGSNVKIIFAKQ